MNAFDESMMREALCEAESALSAGELPVGCVIAKDGAIVARGHNERETTLDPTACGEGAECVAAQRLYAVRYARTVSDVRGRDFAGACFKARLRRARPESGLRGQRLSNPGRSGIFAFLPVGRRSARI